MDPFIGRCTMEESKENRFGSVCGKHQHTQHRDYRLVKRKKCGDYIVPFPSRINRIVWADSECIKPPFPERPFST